METLGFLLFAPIAIQGIITVMDEWLFHRNRPLPLWEVWGHPLDTLTVAVCYLFLLLTEPSLLNAWVYGALALFSCLFVTKDEFVHKEVCSAPEQWLHSLLFIFHPIAFACAGLIWWQGSAYFLQIQLALILAFGLYQILYWGRPWRLLKRRA